MSRSEGFTIIELCVAIVLICMVASASFLGLGSENRQQQQLEEERAATAIATTCLERAKAGVFRERWEKGERRIRCDAVDSKLEGVELWLERSEIEPGLDEIRARVRWRPRATGREKETLVTTWIRRTM